MRCARSHIVLLVLGCLLAALNQAVAYEGMPRTGCLEGTCQNGYGVYVEANGSRYQGYWLNGQRHLWGTQYQATDGSLYAGFWQNNTPHYLGTLYHANGGSYTGLFINGKPANHGLSVSSLGETNYTTLPTLPFKERGCVLGDCSKGLGVAIQEDGSLQAGQWYYGKPHLWSVTYEPGGSAFYGLYKGGIQLSRGLLLNANGNVEVLTQNPYLNSLGCLIGNCEDGFGMYAWGDGSVYVGAWQHGEMTQHGTSLSADGGLFMGYHAFDEPQPRGLRYQPNQPMQLQTQRITFGTPIRATAVAETSEAFTSGAAQRGSLDLVPALENDGQVKVWAVVVGVADYRNIEPLNYTDDDAYRVALFLKSPEGGSLPDERLRILIDDKATKANILKNLKAVCQAAHPQDIIFFYFSGHGKEGAFLPSDYDGRENVVLHSEIQQALEASKANHRIAIADACHAGSLNKVGEALTQSLGTYYTQWQSSGGNTAILMSSKAEETSLEYSGLRQGIFSYFMIKGLKGAADDDKDQVVTISELYQYVRVNVAYYTNNRQTPVINGRYDRLMPLSNLEK